MMERASVQMGAKISAMRCSPLLMMCKSHPFVTTWDLQAKPYYDYSKFNLEQTIILSSTCALMNVIH